ncbi:MAG: hypothetical protein ACT4N2_00820 [Hyphomicrobium sp.]
MATIIDFRSEAMRAGLTAGMAGGLAGGLAARSGPAEIVLFPGVRYERAGDASKSRPRGGKGRRRDQLDLED